MKGRPTRVTFRNFSLSDDATALIDLRKQVWGRDHRHTDVRFFEWLYANSPPGAPDGIIACYGGRAVGFAGLSLKKQWVQGRERTLAHGVDYMVAPDLNGMLSGQVALGVAQRWVQLAHELGCVSGVVFPNDRSLRILTSKRIGFRPVFQPDLLVRPLTTARFTKWFTHLPPVLLTAAFRLSGLAATLMARKPLCSGSVVRVNGFDSEFDTLWSGMRHAIGTATVRDATYLKWRFGDHPIYQYDVFGWHKNGCREGYIVCSSRELFGIDTMLLVDILSPKLTTVGPALINCAVEQAQRRSCGMVVTTALRDSEFHRALRSSGFVVVPNRLAPKRFTAAEIAIDEATDGDSRMQSRYFTWSDMDVV